MDITAAVVKVQRDIGYLHRDAHSDNIMVDPKTGSFNGLIDWDFARKLTPRGQRNTPDEYFLRDEQDLIWQYEQNGFRYHRRRPRKTYIFNEREVGANATSPYSAAG